MAINRLTRNKDPLFWSKHHPGLNCGSFALNLLKWYVPYGSWTDDGYDMDEREDWMHEMWENDCPMEDIEEFVLERDWEHILKDCPWLVPIESLDESAADDRIIAYRLYVKDEGGLLDDDFHFRVRINGFWFDKCGTEKIRFLGTEADEEPWESEDSDLIYTSSIKYAKFKELV